MLVGFSSDQVHVNDYITLKTTFGAKESANPIKVRYIVIYVPFWYNMIIGGPSFNLFEVSLSMPYLFVKYPLLDNKVMFIQGVRR